VIARAESRRGGGSIEQILRICLGGVLAVAAMSLSSCATQTAESFDYMRVTVDGQQTLGVSKKDTRLRGVVIFFHGPDGDEFSITSDEAHKTVTETLVNAGFAVVASQASGNAFGNPQSQQNYRELASMSLGHYHVDNVFFLAESMGTVAAMNILAEPGTYRIRGLAAINPVLDLANVPAPYVPLVANSYPDSTSLELSSPIRFLPDAFADRRIRFYVSSDDALAQTRSNVAAFQQRFGGTTDISVVGCEHGVGDPSCLQGDDILKWFTALEKRS
jgi:pimeloyl-ACP methyl ester carboxylesterase